MLKAFIRDNSGRILFVLSGGQMLAMFRYRFFHQTGSWYGHALDEAIGGMIPLVCYFAWFALRKRNGARPQS